MKIKKKISSLHLLEIFLCLRIGDWILLDFAEAPIVSGVVDIAEGPIHDFGHELKILKISPLDWAFILTLWLKYALLTIEFS